MAESMEVDKQAAEPMDVEPPQEVDLRPIAILVDNLAQEDMQIRITALKQVTRIAEALGSERTRKELIPYLSDMLDDDDEVLRIICEVLIELRNFIGGNEHFYTLISPYETLCVVEENSIRDLAIEKLSVIVSQIPESDISTHIPPLFNRLFSSDWHTARTAAAGLAHHLYPRLVTTPQHCQTLQDNFFQLASDSMPQVRRAVAENMSKFCSKMTPQHAENLSFPVLSKLTEDEQDSVRVRALQALIEIAHLISQPANMKKLRSQISNLCKDPSWRVRFLAASKFGDICTKLDVDQSILELYSKLLKDSEAEVRAIAATQFPGLSKHINEDLMTSKFLSTFKDLSADENKYTRAHVAEVLVPVGTQYSEQFIMTHILPLVLKLLKDPEPEPRLKCLSKLDLSVVNVNDLLDAIMPSLKELAGDSSWRIRQEVLGLLPGLSQRLGADNVDTHIKKLLFTMMTDQVQVVREEAARTVLRICEKLEDDKWANSMLDQIHDQFKKANYLRRQTALEAIYFMVDVLPPEKCLDTLLEFVGDKVPNVRFKLCTTIFSLIEQNKIPLALSGKIIDEMTKLSTDDDPDVSYFATKTIQKLSSLNKDKSVS
jgi:serine/threonine-protein phosphatase 2A regulatory subunit A